MAQSQLPDVDAISTSEASKMMMLIFKVAEILVCQIAEPDEKIAEQSHEKHKLRES